MSREYGAPWSLLLKGTTFSVITLLVLVAVVAWSADRRDESVLFVVLLPLLIIGGTWFFAVLGYELAGDTLVIRRPFRTTQVSLKGLREVREDPVAMRRSLRVFGNGGLFAFTGLFHNRDVGRFRAYVTDRSRAVFLFLGDGKVVAVSPDDPKGFARRLRSQAGLEERS